VVNTVDRVDVVRYGGWGWAPGWEIFWMDMQAKDDALALLGLVIRAGDNTILVNCGPDPDYLPNMNAHWAKGDPRHNVEVKPDEQLEAALGSVGVTLDEVTHVIATPFQAYALGNILRFPNAQICLSRTGWIDFHAPRWRPHPHDNRPFCIPDDVLVGLVTHAWPRVRLVDDDVIVPGVETFWTGVHHRSSLAVKVHTENGTVIASDAFMRVENITRRHPIGINESMEEALTAYTRIAEEADILVPLYDPYVFDRHPGGRIA
jgi:hypothetical protein